MVFWRWQGLNPGHLTFRVLFSYGESTCMNHPILDIGEKTRSVPKSQLTTRTMSVEPDNLSCSQVCDT